jgi:hypothetical protein
MIMHRLIPLTALTLLTAPAAASTSAAWLQLEKEAKRSCIQVSQFRAPRASAMVVFDDATGVAALLVTGTYRQPHMKGAKGTNLCLYNRRTKKAVAEEARGWSAKP